MSRALSLFFAEEPTLMSMKNTVTLLTISVLPFLHGCGGEAPKEEVKSNAPAAAAPKTEAAPAAGATTGTASISGKISYPGTVPPAEKLKVSGDPYCASVHKGGLERQSILVKDGAVANVVVYVKSGASGTYPPPTTSVELNQTGCTYDPHVVALQVGQTLEIVNSDPIMHNIHPHPKLNEEFNLGQPKPGKKPRTFDKAEVLIPVGCDVHPWMRSYIAVLANPFYAVTKDDGTFQIKGLPAGEYEVEAVHEKLKGGTQKVTVKDGEAAKLDFTLKES
jgi:plastocyanin